MICKNIHDLRMEAKISQTELAKALNIGASTVNMWEKGTRKPSVLMLVRLSKIFNCTVDELLK